MQRCFKKKEDWTFIAVAHENKPRRRRRKAEHGLKESIRKYQKHANKSCEACWWSEKRLKMDFDIVKEEDVFPRISSK